MRQLLIFMMIALLLAPALVAGSPGPVDNGIGVLGIYTETVPRDDIDQLHCLPFVTYDLYFVLSYPVAPSRFLGDAAFSWRFEPATAAPQNVQLILPPQSVSIGDTWNVIIGFATGAPVIGGHALVCTARVMWTTDEDPLAEIYLGPPIPNSVPGYMEYLDFMEIWNIQPAVPHNIHSSFAEPVFVIGNAVAAERSTLSDIKALFD